MIDGITIKYTIKDFTQWNEAVKPSLAHYVGSFGDSDLKTKKRENTVITTHRGKFETYDLIIKEVENIATRQTNHYLTIKGSLHKNKYGGSNYQPLTFEQLQTEIKHICNSLSMAPKKVQISVIEIGLNVCTPFEVYPFICQNIIAYKGQQFSKYKPSRDGKSLGIVCHLSQYAVKIYDKGLQYDLPENLLRFELRFLKMQPINKAGVKTLADLQNIDVYNRFKSMLLEAWQNVLIYDIRGPVKDLPTNQPERELLRNGRNPKFWERLKRERGANAYKYHVGKFKKLVEKYGLNTGRIVYDLLKKEWGNLYKNYPNLPSGKKEKLPEFTIKIKGKNGQSDILPVKRYCKGCGHELHPDQSPRSVFCSAKYVGNKQAHKCRNGESNPRNNLKRKIERIEARGTLFDIGPYLKVG